MSQGCTHFMKLLSQLFTHTSVWELQSQARVFWPVTIRKFEQHQSRSRMLPVRKQMHREVKHIA